MVVLASAVAACGGAAEPGDAAVEYASRPGGVFLGGLRPDLGWRAGEVFVSDEGDCAAAALITEDGWGTVMILASLEHHVIPDIYVGSPGYLERIEDQVGGLGWVPVPSLLDHDNDPDVNAYRLGLITFGPNCEQMFSDG